MHCSASFLHLPFDADSSRIAVSSHGDDYRYPNLLLLVLRVAHLTWSPAGRLVENLVPYVWITKKHSVRISLM